MTKKLTQKSRFESWIDAKSLLSLKIKSRGHIGGCILIPYVITDDGKRYFVKRA